VLGLSGSWLLVLAATGGGAAVLLLVLWVSYRISDAVVILIVGLMIGNVTLSVVGIWQYFSQPEQIQDYVLWTLGSLHSVTPRHLPVLVTVVGAGALLSLLVSKPLNALLLGENYARSLGLNIRQVRGFIILITSVLAGSVTGFCGPIGFVGVAVPHLTRALLNTTNHFVLVPGVMVIGAIVMLGCDIISQVPGSQTVLPINAVTALVGSPVVIWVVLRQRNSRVGFNGKG
jgi:iron complex transport system permease protein